MLVLCKYVSYCQGMKKTERRSPCPIACALDLIGDKWTLLVIRDLWCGRTHFKEFLNSPEGIATNILAERLRRLLDEGFVERFSSDEVLGKQAYRLTKRGQSLVPLLEAVKVWGLAQIKGTKVYMQPAPK